MFKLYAEAKLIQLDKEYTKPINVTSFDEFMNKESNVHEKEIVQFIE
jgi:hypothetical protein